MDRFVGVKLRFFGRPWGVPMLEGAERVCTPIGEECGWCSEPIRLGERGVIRVYVSELGTALPEPLHRECDLRAVLGGVNHLKGRCSCHGGSEDPDPPGVSRREAARMTLAYSLTPQFQSRVSH